MKLRVYSTSRQIRELYAKLGAGFLDHKPLTLGEFFKRAIIADGKKFIDADLQKIYLFEAKKGIDTKALGIAVEFLDFLKSADLVLGFFKELFLERVKIEDVLLEDTYAEYGEHLEILKQWYADYKELLKSKDLVDDVTIEDFRINERYLDQFDSIEIELHGYLSRFDRSILDRIERPIVLHFIITPFNKKLFKKMFDKEFELGEYRYDYHKKEVLEHSALKSLPQVEVASFSERIDQVHYVLASIEEFVKAGADPSKIAVILPDESFGEYLRLFNEPHNLNFAFGSPFDKSDFYIKLKALYDYMVEKDPIAYEKIENIWEEFEKIDDLEAILDYLFTLANEKEKILLEEEIFKIKKLLPHIPQEKKRFLRFLLDRFADLSFDDVGGGKVTVMGVLESRGVEFDGVVIVDFNEDVVPKVSESDYFLNSTVRKHAGLPTRADKEALQKSYYYQLLLHSKRVRISYVKNEEQSPSRFLYELGLDDGTHASERYQNIAFRLSYQPNFYSYEGERFDMPSYFSPTSLYTLLECPMKYYLHYVKKIKNDLPDEEENFGSKFHDVLEEVVSRKSFATPSIYAKQVLDGLTKDLPLAKRFAILSQWEGAIYEFCKRDFERAKRALIVRKKDLFCDRYLGSIKLQAAPDRIDEEFVYDYKTGSKPKKSKFSKDELQSLFYAYIFDKPSIFYYIKEKDEKRYETSSEEAVKRLQELIDGIECVAKRSEDLKPCQWCEYKFVCQRG